MGKEKRTLDIDKIKTPKVIISQEAQWQIANMLANDPYLQEKYLRITIDGKGCDGFTYAIGFTKSQETDFCIDTSVEIYPHHLNNNSPNTKLKKIKTKILFDPFAAFYLSDVKIDYKIDIEQDLDGLIVTNSNQDLYHGKFWRKAKNQTPPEKSKNLS